MSKLYMQIKDKQIPLILRNYKNTSNIKMYFNGTTFNISKPKYVSNKKVFALIKENEEKIYKQYLNIISEDSDIIKHWKTGEKFLYGGEYYTIDREYTPKKRFSVELNNDKKLFKIFVPSMIEEEMLVKQYIDKMIKKLLQNNTGAIIQERLPYWSNITKINYSSFNVRDAKTKYGSCKPDTGELYFSSRLAMLPQAQIDAIIVHELCHMIYRNHSNNFYDLVKEYIPNYDEINKWLKKNAKELMF